jgi:ATP-binding cassette subfamily C protein
VEAFLEIIRQEAKPIHMTVNTPFLMDKPDKVWFIDQGQINVYTVQLNNGEPEGQRFYFFTAEQHQVLLGLDSANAEQNIGFSADATKDTLVYEFDLARLKELALEPDHLPVVARFISDWVTNLFFGVSENENHPNKAANVLIKKGERVILRAGESISAQKKVVWAAIRPRKASTLLINGSGKISPPEDQLLLPLCRESFWESSGNLGLKFIDTAEAIQQEAAWQGLHALDSTLFTLEKNAIDFVARNEQIRLKAKYQNQYIKTIQTLKDAEAILNREAADKYAKGLRVQTDDVLFNACQIVADPSRIRLVPPLENTKEGFDPIGDIARASKVRYREVLLESKWWQQDSGALLSFLKDGDTPIALMPVKGNRYEAYNPVTKETFRVTDKNVHLIDKVAYTFYKPFPQKKITLMDLLKFGLFKEKRDFYILIIMGLAGTALGLITPILTGVLFDTVIPNAGKYQVLHVGFALFMALIGYILFELTEGFALLRIETKMDHSLQAAVWDRLLDLPASFFRNFTTGDLADRAMGINEIRKLLSGVVITTILSSVFSLLNFFLLFYYSVRLALVALAISLVEVILMYWIGRWQIAKEKKALNYDGKTQGIVLQLLNGISKFRVTGTEIRAFNHWLRLFTKSKQYSFEAARVENIQTVINSIMPLLASGIIYWAFFTSKEWGQLSTGQFLAFNAAYGAFLSAILAMSAASLTIFQVFPIYERTRPILETLPENDDRKSNPGRLKGNIEVSKVNFRYNKDAPLVLNNISLRLRSGEYVAFVGASGSGKSTLIRLLLGFERPEVGSIFYDNQDLNKLDLRLVRRQIGVVLQDGQLTPGDIFSNIVGSSPQLTMDDAWEAAKMAAFDEDIKQMPMGMHTIISEGGSTLSGGQKQRLLIARTLVHKPRIVMFDEATSALDNRTQAVITESLNKLQATRVVIAHRLSTIRNVDKVFVFDQGKIAQVGSYDDLMQEEGLFKDLATRQLA